MKSISILGTSSDAGKSWLNTAFCALMRRKGVKVAPFKAQNMSNNSFVTVEGGEIGRAQAVQAEACGLRPIAEMNPVLLKPSGDTTSQVVRLGAPGPHMKAQSFYEGIHPLWETVQETLEWWKSRCDLLLLEGAGSPVELNLMDRDIVNLMPIRYLDGKWLLACDIERGGVFAQATGTVKLMPEEDQSRGLGLVVNKFRGDPTLFDGAAEYFSKHVSTPYLGVLPMRYDLQPETEDGFTVESRISRSQSHKPLIAWVCYPRVSNTQDIQPWSLDEGVQARWVRSIDELEQASAIVLPGSKNTIADLQWLRDSGIADMVIRKAREGIPVVGICGGYQMLGERLLDPGGEAGRSGEVEGLSLLPIVTEFSKEKRLTQVQAIWGAENWNCYEIHMGHSRAICTLNALLKVKDGDGAREEGSQDRSVWGTYLHGLFENSCTRLALCEVAGISGYEVGVQDWWEHKQQTYSQMADLLEEHLDLEGVYRYVGM